MARVCGLFFAPFLISFILFFVDCSEPKKAPLHPLTNMATQFLLPRMTDRHQMGLSTCVTLLHPLHSFLSPPSAVFRWVMEMRELTVVAGSFIGFQFLFTVASPWISSAVTPGYGRLPSTKLIEWNSRYVIWVHCVCTGKRLSHLNV